MLHRRALLALLAAAAAADARAQDPARYWPVVTDHPNALDIARERADGVAVGASPLRRFNAPRPAARADNPTRRHVGVDLFAYARDAVVAIEAGRLVAFYPFLRAAAGPMSYALIVAHAGYVANFGEVRADSLAARGLSLGAPVAAGQQIAAVSATRQLHFETYDPGVVRSASWPHGAERPAAVRDPTPLLLQLAAAGLRLRPAPP